MTNYSQGHDELNGQERERKHVNPNSMDMNEHLEDKASRIKDSASKNNKTNNDQVTKPINKETKNLDEMAENNQEIDRFYHEQMDKKMSVIDKLLNRPMYEEMQRVKSELLKSSASYRLNFYKTLLDARIEALKEKCDSGLKMIKGHYRQKANSFLMAKLEEMALEVKDRQINFMEMMKSKYSYAETLDAYPTMKDRYMESIFQEEGRNLKFLDSLLIRFADIVDEQLR